VEWKKKSVNKEEKKDTQKSLKGGGKELTSLRGLSKWGMQKKQEGRGKRKKREITALR